MMDDFFLKWKVVVSLLSYPYIPMYLQDRSSSDNAVKGFGAGDNATIL
jgi:hypothetical protein